MAKTDGFRRQHDDLLAIATSISELLTPDKAASEAQQIRGLLSKLGGKLSIHLAMEDNSLYPGLLSKTDAGDKAVVEAFINEMGGIAEAFGGYVSAWPSSSAIEADPAGFVEQTKSIFAALSSRIERENNQLYVIADKL
jgi:hemerythrin-like domain-containing protein